MRHPSLCRDRLAAGVDDDFRVFMRALRFLIETLMRKPLVHPLCDVLLAVPFDSTHHPRPFVTFNPDAKIVERSELLADRTHAFDDDCARRLHNLPLGQPITRPVIKLIRRLAAVSEWFEHLLSQASQVKVT